MVTGASASGAATPATDFQLTLSSSLPSSPTAADLYILYKRPGQPNAKPSALRRVVISAPPGSRYDGGAVPACAASDQQLMAEGRGACPAASDVGSGTVTALTGFGPPVDPVTLDATFFNQGSGVIQLLTQHGTNVAVADVHGVFTAPNTITFHVPSEPGGPPDFSTSVRRVNVRINEVGSPARPFLATPPRCPASRRWVSQLTYSTADGHTYAAQSTTPCSARASSAGDAHDPAASASRGPTAFSGSCQLSGTVRFEPPLTTAPQTGRVYATAPGTCNGTLTTPAGHVEPTNGMLVRADAHSAGTESCASGSGTGYLNFDGDLLRFTYTEQRAGPALALEANGANGGSAIAEANISPSANPATILQACGSTGLTAAPIDIRLTTAGTIYG